MQRKWTRGLMEFKSLVLGVPPAFLGHKPMWVVFLSLATKSPDWGEKIQPGRLRTKQLTQWKGIIEVRHRVEKRSEDRLWRLQIKQRRHKPWRIQQSHLDSLSYVSSALLRLQNKAELLNRTANLDRSFLRLDTHLHMLHSVLGSHKPLKAH